MDEIDVAWAPRRRRWLVVTTDQVGVVRTVRSRVLDGAGRPIGGQHRVAPLSDRVVAPSVGAVDSGFIVAYALQPAGVGGNAEARTVAVGFDGRARGRGRRVARRIGAAGFGAVMVPRIATNGRRRALLSMAAGSDFRVRLMVVRALHPDGRPQGPERTLAAGAAYRNRPSVAWDGRRFVVAWDESPQFPSRSVVRVAAVGGASRSVRPFPDQAGAWIARRPGGGTVVAFAGTPHRDTEIYACCPTARLSKTGADPVGSRYSGRGSGGVVLVPGVRAGRLIAAWRAQPQPAPAPTSLMVRALKVP
jgi:hypothetical protein